MKPLLKIFAVTVVLVASAAIAGAIHEEHVTNGMLDLTWVAGYERPANPTPNNGEPLTLDSSHPAYANPSGDHTVLRAQISDAAAGSIVLSATDPGGLSDYIWEGWVFLTGNANTGLVVRANPDTSFVEHYSFIVRPSLVELRFRRLAGDDIPVTLQSWPSPVTITPNTWHKMKVAALGSTFRCYFDDIELTAGSPIIDATYPTGWVGVYDFSVNIPGHEAFFDDLILNGDLATKNVTTTWGQVKSRYRN